jgi:dihydrofolate synthase/folylpolyglutamate synthase
LAFGIEPSLDAITALTRRLGDSQLCYPCIQIAGTNGKTSTARFTAAFLRSQGKKVGLYTSPELVEYPERMEIDGTVVSHELFAEAVHVAHDVAQQALAAGELAVVTEFELLTAAALWLFASERVDYAVLEVGLGGRWDATSVVTPRVAVITGIDLDHTAILGDTVEAIAAEKATIIRPGCIPILGPGTGVAGGVFQNRCDEVGVTALHIKPGEGLPPPLAAPRFPRYQEQNIACALAATEAALGAGATLDLAALQQVLDTLALPGRFEFIREQPPLLIDASHNPQSAQILAQALAERFGTNPQTKRLDVFDTLLLGILADKDAHGIIEALAPLFAQVVVTRSTSPRAIPADELAQMVAQVDGRQPEVFASVAAALVALTVRQAAVVATGSITLAGEVKREIDACLRPCVRPCLRTPSA